MKKIIYFYLISTVVITTTVISVSQIKPNKFKEIQEFEKQLDVEAKQYQSDKIKNDIFIRKYTEQILIEKGWEYTTPNYNNAEKLAIIKIKKEYSIN